MGVDGGRGVSLRLRTGVLHGVLLPGEGQAGLDVPLGTCGTVL